MIGGKGSITASSSSSIEKHKKVDSSSEDESDGKNFKKGKFSAAESQIVKTAMEKYCADMEIDITSLSPYHRATEESSNRFARKAHKNLWKSLMGKLPNRSRMAIYQHGMRLILNLNVKTGPFSEEEKQRLMQLIEIHGHNFQEVGRLMDRRPDDCKQLLIKLQSGHVTGRFTNDEDKQLLAAIRTVTNTKKGKLVPRDAKISWKDVATLLENHRTPLDYLKHWGASLVVKQEEVMKSKKESSDNEKAIKKSPSNDSDQKLSVVPRNVLEEERLAKSARIFEELVKRDALDITEINFSSIDKELGMRTDSAKKAEYILEMIKKDIKARSVNPNAVAVTIIKRGKQKKTPSTTETQNKRKLASDANHLIPAEDDPFASSDDESDMQQLTSPRNSTPPTPTNNFTGEIDFGDDDEAASMDTVTKKEKRKRKKDKSEKDANNKGDANSHNLSEPIQSMIASDNLGIEESVNGKNKKLKESRNAEYILDQIVVAEPVVQEELKKEKKDKKIKKSKQKDDNCSFEQALPIPQPPVTPKKVTIQPTPTIFMIAARGEEEFEYVDVTSKKEKKEKKKDKKREKRERELEISETDDAKVTKKHRVEETVIDPNEKERKHKKEKKHKRDKDRK